MAFALYRQSTWSDTGQQVRVPYYTELSVIQVEISGLAFILLTPLAKPCYNAGTIYIIVGVAE
jgi:hypothetical protein